MKKALLSLLCLILMGTAAMAQKTFEGQITYSFSFEGEGFETMAALMPTAMTIDILKNETSVEMQGGLMSSMIGRVFSISKKNKSYMIKDGEKVAYEISMENAAKPSEVSSATKEDEVLDIQGYACQKYKVVSKTADGESVSYVWTTDKLMMPTMNGSNGSMAGMLASKGAPGTPLKVMVIQNGLTVVLTVTKISTTKPSKNLFKIPKGYSIEPMKL